MSGPEAFRAVKRASPSIQAGLIGARPVITGQLRLQGITIPATVFLMRAPHSYTREDMVEIHTIGAQALLQMILEHFIKKGVRLAEPGEFTKRAFLNGRINLAQAEAVLDIIKSHNDRACLTAQQQLSGHSSRRIKVLQQSLIELISRIELGLDFSDQEIEIVTPSEVKRSIASIAGQISRMVTGRTQSLVHKDGITCVLCGRPNVGKSSIFNRLVPDRKNIVSPIPGTTRDYIEGVMDYKGVRFRIIDTAGITNGIRDAGYGIGDDNDLVYKTQRQTHQILAQADVYLVVIDGHTRLSRGDLQIVKDVDVRRLVLIINKSDLDIKYRQTSTKAKILVKTSAKTGAGITRLKDNLVKLVKAGASGQPADSPTGVSYDCPANRGILKGDVTTVNARHQECLRKALESLNRAIKQGTSLEPSCGGAHLMYELVAVDLREALNYLGEIAGETVLWQFEQSELLPGMVGCPSDVSDKGALQPRIPGGNSFFKPPEYNSLHSNSRTITDDILNNIFSRFCIGK